MPTVEVSNAMVKGNAVPLFRKMKAYVELMNQQRALGSNKSRVIKLGADDYSTVLKVAPAINKLADGITYKGYPVERMGAQ